MEKYGKIGIISSYDQQLIMMNYDENWGFWYSRIIPYPSDTLWYILSWTLKTPNF
jgi:hypothetical protein